MSRPKPETLANVVFPFALGVASSAAELWQIDGLIGVQQLCEVGYWHLGFLPSRAFPLQLRTGLSLSPMWRARATPRAAPRPSLRTPSTPSPARSLRSPAPPSPRGCILFP